MDRIREIEQEIDNFHKSAAIFSVNRSQALFDVLRIFEDTCRFAALQSLILPAEEVEGFSRAQMDGLKTAINGYMMNVPIRQMASHLNLTIMIT